MSRRHDIQDGTGVVERLAPVGELQHWARTTPTNTASGFATGCIWHNIAGTVGSVLYVNVGTNTSAIWVNIA